MRELNVSEIEKVSGGWIWIRGAFETISAFFVLDDAVENINSGFAARKAEILEDEEKED